LNRDLGTDRLNHRVRNMPRGSIEQALDRFFDRRDLLKTASRSSVPSIRSRPG
jgi:hypothetical protein